jgi:formylmethanofuran dehydrogenase subunit E
LGLRLLGIDDPKGKDRKSFMVYVEIDRCATDAIQSVTGCSLGKRSLRWIDYGIMAATFVHLVNGKAFRIVAKEESRELSHKYCPEIKDKYKRQLEAYKLMSDKELFKIQEVKVEIPAHDLPGRPISRIQCNACGDYVQDCREVKKANGEALCRACAYGPYYKVVKDLEELEWA